jgi:hypothetical protein
LRPENKRSRIILALCLTAVALYACALPLWEGWDEAFHYGRLESMAVQHDLGTYRKSTLPGEVADSLMLTPVSHLLAALLPGSRSFSQWHELPLTQRIDLHDQLLRLSPERRRDGSTILNYETQQAPLAYAVTAPLDWSLGRVQLVPRVLILRWILGLGSMALTYGLMLRLARIFQIEPPFREALLLCSLSVQMLWASVAHIGNDAFAIPLTVWFVVLMLEDSSLVALSCALGIGLLTKAYFLSFVPVFVALVVTRVRSGRASWKQAAIAMLIPVAIGGPWYARNLFLYESFSGTQETVAGVTFSSAIRAIPHINWAHAFMKLWRDSLWTENETFTTFDRSTLQIVQALMLLGLGLKVAASRKPRKAEGWMWAAAVCFLAGLFYQTCVTWTASNGLSVSPEPWYGQGMLLCVWALVFQGYRAFPKIGRVAAALLCLVSLWIGTVTFVAKILPDYGRGVERSNLRSLVGWWRAHPTQDLALIMPAHPYLIYALLVTFLTLAGATLVVIARFLIRWEAG